MSKQAATSEAALAATEEKPSDGVRAVERALDILVAFQAGDHQLSAGDLLKRVDLSRPTLYRLLRTLENKGFVVGAGDPQRFALGPAVAHLAHVWGSSLDLGTVAQPMLRRLWEQTGETVALLVHQGSYRVCVAELPSDQPLSFKRGVGHRENVTRGASGRVILAHLPAPESHVPEEERKGLKLAAFRARLDRVRAQGYEVSRDELIKGAVAVAAPFFLGNDRVLGSIAVFGPGVRVDDAHVERFAELLRSEAKKLSQALGQK